MFGIPSKRRSLPIYFILVLKKTLKFGLQQTAISSSLQRNLTTALKVCLEYLTASFRIIWENGGKLGGKIREDRGRKMRNKWDVLSQFFQRSGFFYRLVRCRIEETK